MPTTQSPHGRSRGAGAPAFFAAFAADREARDQTDGPGDGRAEGAGAPRGRAPVPPPRPRGGIYRALRDAIMRNMRDESDRPWE